MPLREVVANTTKRSVRFFKDRGRELLKQLVAVLLVSLSRFGVSGLESIDIAKLRGWLVRHPTATALILTIVAVGVGRLASYWKQHAQTSYGVAEALFGAALSFNVLLHIAPQFDFSKVFAVGSGIYVVARGFNNMFEARSVLTGGLNGS